ncbi:uncharacterized protein LOC131936825 isoform X2 [Physella acuta]|uniref:uncharacterized protein LOC131936825 isoform X2 n=1 Tax=Physella acuta TaxID=109671 RepID=UPI0027DBAF4E|nr:uncharacterized protein LOC131936825 isoform X2 [Physella acuta]
MLIWPALLLVLGHVCPLTSAENAPASVHTSANPSGVQCGAYKCLTGATCVPGGNCSCPALGDGEFRCYTQNSVKAELSGPGNVLKLFHSPSLSAPFRLPCRFRFSEISVATPAGHQCHLQVLGTNTIIDKYIVLSGIQVNIKYTTSTSNNWNEISLLIEGLSENGTFTYKERGKTAFSYEVPKADIQTLELDEELDGGSGSGDGETDPSGDSSGSGTGSGSSSGSGDSSGSGGGSGAGANRKTRSVAWADEDDTDSWGPTDDLDIDNELGVSAGIDTDNFATLTLSACSLRVGFRAPDKSHVQQDQVSGMYLEYSGDPENLEFIDPETYLADSTNGATFLQYLSQTSLTATQALLDKSLQYAAEQTSTPLGDVCEKTRRDYMEHCNTQDKKIAALKHCSSIFEDTAILENFGGRGY